MATHNTRSRSKATPSLPEDIANLSALLLQDEPETKGPGAKPKKKSTRKETASAAMPTADHEDQSVEQLIRLESLRNQNLKLQAEIARTQLEMATLNGSAPAARPNPASSESLEALLASTPQRATASVPADIPTLDSLRARKKTGSLLPNNYLFSSKGKVEYEKMDITEFVCGFLEMVKDQPEQHQARFFSYLKLQAWLKKTTYTKRTLQQLLGKLSDVTACVRPGRAFMARLLNALKSCGSRCGKHKVTTDIRLDIEWWINFLSQFNGISVIPTNVIISNPELFAKDACPLGCGSVCFGEYFHRHFPSFIQDQHLHINELELLTAVVAIKLWASKLSGLSVELLSDNTTC